MLGVSAVWQPSRRLLVPLSGPDIYFYLFLGSILAALITVLLLFDVLLLISCMPWP